MRERKERQSHRLKGQEDQEIREIREDHTMNSLIEGGHLALSLDDLNGPGCLAIKSQSFFFFFSQGMSEMTTFRKSHDPRSRDEG